LFVWGAGSDIWGTEDSFQFVYQPIRVGRIAAAVFELRATDDPFAKAGLMIRQSLDPASAHVIVDVKPDGGIEFMSRSSAGGETTFLAGRQTQRTYVAFKLMRSGGLVTAEVCTRTGCEVLGSIPWLSGPALIGFAVTSHDPTRLALSGVPARLPDVSTVPEPWSHYDVGAVGQPGHALFEEDTFYIAGAGGDIWGTADAFQFMAQRLTDDGEIIARVVSQDGTHPFAKAGVMIRAGPRILPPVGAAAVILDVRPTGDIEFMARSADGENMVFVTGASAQGPVWLRLARKERTIAAFTSVDGIEWQPLGTVDVELNDGYPYPSVGLAVTSHDPDVLNTAVFDSVRATISAPDENASNHEGPTTMAINRRPGR
jgi:hypothetical protein